MCAFSAWVNRIYAPGGGVRGTRELFRFCIWDGPRIPNIGNVVRLWQVFQNNLSVVGKAGLKQIAELENELNVMRSFNNDEQKVMLQPMQFSDDEELQCRERIPKSLPLAVIEINDRPKAALSFCRIGIRQDQHQHHHHHHHSNMD